MHNLAQPTVFGGDLTDPGAAAPFGLPVRNDLVRFAGMRDIFGQMYRAAAGQLTVTEGAAGTESWGATNASGSGGLPGLTQTVTVDPSFFAAPASVAADTDRVKYLIRLMATRFSTISAPYRQKYANAADVLRAANRLGP